MTTLLVVVCKKNNINNYFVVGDITLYIVQAVLHVMLILRDPGILPITQDINKQKGNDEVYCNKCNIYAKRSDALYHCAICDICVSLSEYHCAYTQLSTVTVTLGSALERIIMHGITCL